MVCLYSYARPDMPGYLHYMLPWIFEVPSQSGSKRILYTHTHIYIYIFNVSGELPYTITLRFPLHEKYPAASTL